MKKNKLVAMTMVATLTVGGSVSAFAQGQGFGGAQRSNTLGQEQRGERPEAVDGEKAERPERAEKSEKAEKGADFTATLTEAGIDLEAFKELSKEEQATVLAEAGFEMPEMTERAEKGADFTARLTEAGIDLETFKELSKEEQATVLAEVGFEVPTMTERADKGGKAEKGADFTATLTEAGIDLEAFKELSKEEQATVLAEAGFEVPAMPERAEKGERTEMPERAGKVERTKVADGELV